MHFSDVLPTVFGLSKPLLKVQMDLVPLKKALCPLALAFYNAPNFKLHFTNTVCLDK